MTKLTMAGNSGVIDVKLGEGGNLVNIDNLIVGDTFNFLDFLVTYGGAGNGDNRNDIGGENTFRGPARDSFTGFELATLV